MNTYGLNRHLNSFGLSYPGYWFVIIETPDGGFEIFYAWGATDYLAIQELLDFAAKHNTVYIARSGADMWRIFESEGSTDYEASASPRYFDARINRTYNKPIPQLTKHVVTGYIDGHTSLLGIGWVNIELTVDGNFATWGETSGTAQAVIRGSTIPIGIIPHSVRIRMHYNTLNIFLPPTRYVQIQDRFDGIETLYTFDNSEFSNTGDIVPTEWRTINTPINIIHRRK